MSVRASCLSLLLLCACGPEAPAPDVPATGAVCPPCRMEVQPHYERIEAGGLRFAVCNPRCGEIVLGDPARFASDALP